MKFRTTLLLLILFLICSNSFGQQPGSMVVANSGIFIRDSSSIDSNKKCSVKFGEMIEILNEPHLKDTVDGMKGNWWKVKYNSCIGYVFDAYLANIFKQDKRFENLPQFFRLHVSCGADRYFNSDYNWYGIFDRDEKWAISSVKIDFSVKKENWSDEMYDQYLQIKLENENKPHFLIGFPDSISNYETKKHEFQGGAIFPGQSFLIGYAKSGTSYYIAAYGSTEEFQGDEHFTPPHIGLQNYKLKIIERTSNGVKYQNLWQEIEDNTIGESMPFISFVGDLNNDNIPDLIISHGSHYAESTTHVFMSGYNDDKILTKVAENYWGSCY